MEQPVSTLALQAAIVLGLPADWAIGVTAITPSLRDISGTIRRSARERTQLNKRLPLDRQLPVEHAMPYGISADLLNSWPQVIAMSDDPRVLAVLAAYRRLPKGLAKHFPIEGFCVAANFPPSQLLIEITNILARQSAAASAIITAVNQPRVIQKTVDMALTDEGFADRKLFHTATGFLPTNKKGIVITNNMPQAAAPIQNVMVVAPNPENVLKGAVSALHEQRVATAIDVTSSASASPPTAPMPAAAVAPQATPEQAKHAFLDVEEDE